MRNMVPLAVSDHFVDINEMVDEVRLAILHPQSSIFVSNPVTQHSTFNHQPSAPAHS